MPNPKATKPEYDAGHVPITEEFDSARRNLPPVAPVAIALALVAVVIGIVMYAFRAKPVAQGQIDDVYVSTQANQSNIFVPIQITLRNVSDRTLYIKDIKATVKTDQGELSDDAASPTDYERYFQAFPDLRAHSTQALVVEMKIPPAGEQKGTVLVSYPLTKDQFDARKDLSVIIDPYDQKPIVLREKGTTRK